MKRIIITGAQFKNKGAQSLLFSFISSVKKQFPDCQFFYVPLDSYESYDRNNCKFNIVYFDKLSLEYESGNIIRFKAGMKCLAKQILKRKGPAFSQIKEWHQCLTEADVLVDLSGYQLSSNWSLHINKRYLRFFQEAIKHNVPVFIFPQSFGPFLYGKNQEEMDQLIKDVLSKTVKIYAREEYGFRLLKEKYNLKNVELTPDFVLQCENPDWNDIYVNEPISNYVPITETHTVGIVPNFQNFRHGSHDEILGLYQWIINELLKLNKKVVIFRHSEDLDVCHEIYDSYKNNLNVELNEYEFSCFEYSEYVKGFEYIVAARYHAIVHAYKVGVPAIVLGWAMKYQDLTKLFEQQNYAIDTSSIGSQKQIEEIVDLMDKQYLTERKKLLNRKAELQTNYCLKEMSTFLQKRQ